MASDYAPTPVEDFLDPRRSDAGAALGTSSASSITAAAEAAQRPIKRREPGRGI